MPRALLARVSGCDYRKDVTLTGQCSDGFTVALDSSKLLSIGEVGEEDIFTQARS